MTCPGCKTDVVPDPVGFTWWGGYIGSKIISHVQCPACGVRFNGKSGNSNIVAITAYLIIATLIGIAAVMAVGRI